MYDEEYFNSGDADCGAHGPKSYMDQASEGDASRVEGAHNLDDLVRRVVPDRGRFLEVGCGPGFLLQELRALGWDVAGIELSQYAVDFARNQLGLNVKQGSIRADEWPAETADAVFLGDVLEHLPDPVGSLEVIRSWLQPGGALAIAVPSTMSLWSAQLGLTAYRVLGREKVLRIPPYHLMEFVPSTLRRTMETAGFEVVRIRVGAVPISRMGLRGSPIENSGKVALQLAAHATSRALNRWGDRILALGRRPGL
ncbi:MAG: class I SAM-dependent methyltransferase [Candidatus Eisenbacteria bacterium]|uniref:Class I SAM-dependent methyltransferase n=1 Tax=Eiseniibacteriota bacterium TaxID=2212470 RepID=A0A956SCI1_UNCEI|nr:class I SAM-dependent methyltransferase [Candidatus Eisenbacteria bacterium]